MPETQHLPVVLILLAAAVLIVALFRKLRVSPVLGYLVAGALIGPGGIRLITDVGGTAAIAEFGVVFLLFIIGLELSWERLTVMRKQTFFVGIAQIVITTFVLAGGFHFMGFNMETSIIIGGGLALSSTALVLQLIAEYTRKASQIGRLSLAVLLIQDLAVVPLLVMVPAIAQHSQSLAMELGNVFFKAIIALFLIFFLGRILLRPLYRLVASLHNPEIFTALTLFVVLGTAWLTDQAHLSLALGAFMAGLLMAETEYRHQVEADVMPYKGLFLGLFFMAVGMRIDTQIMMHHLPLIIGLAIWLMLTKSLILYALCRLFGFGITLSAEAGLLLSQGGEFAFILFGLAAGEHFITNELAQTLMMVVTLTMALTPFAAALGRWVTQRRDLKKQAPAEDSAHEMMDIRNHVIILGFGRVGQTIAKLLSAEGIHYIALDMQPGTVAQAKKIGLPVYYGDGSRREVLNAIGIERASAAIVTVNEPVAAEHMVRALRNAVKALPIIARAHDLQRVLLLEAAGANVAVSEMFEASLQLGGALLKSLGIADQEILRIIEIFRDRDYALARGTLEVKAGEQGTPYGKMLAFQHAVVSGVVVKE
jgi:CPA2 family monovalent cation:H+ antiporter-2